MLQGSAQPVVSFLCYGESPILTCLEPEALPLGLMFSAVGIGAVTGAILVASLPAHARRGRMLTLGNLGLPVVLLAFVNSKIFIDLLPNRGALGGIYSGLFFSSFQYTFCVACDMPFLNESVIQYLINNIQEYDVIVPKMKDGLQPLHAIYSKSCLGPIKKFIDQGKFKTIDFYPEVRIKTIEEKEFYELDPMLKSFINVNTQEELLLIKKEINSQ